LRVTVETDNALPGSSRTVSRWDVLAGRFRLTARQAALAFAFIATYALLDWAVNAYASGANADTPWNPPPGLGLAWLLIFGLSWAPVLFAAMLVAEFLRYGDSFYVSQSALLSATATAIYAGLARILRRGPLAINITLSRMRDLVLFSLCTALAAFLVAVANVVLEHAANNIWQIEAVKLVVRHWIGDVVGILVLTPLILLCRSGPPRFAQRGHDAFAQGLGIIASALIAFWVVYGNVPTEQITSLYLFFLPLTWAAIRFGLFGAVATSLALQVGIILLSHLGSQSDATVLQFQIRLLVIGGTGLFLGAAVDELHATEQKLRERQAQLDRTLRLAASSELASAMAHELNQPLSAIGLYARTCELLLHERPVPELRETMAKISAEVRRAGDVVHKLREFYRSGGSVLRTISVSQLMDDAVQTIKERATSQEITVSLDVDAHLPGVSVDRTQIETVLHNLLVNAIEAIRDANSVVRRINLSAMTAPGDMIEVCIRDTGPGMNVAEIQQVFNPFSSSKTYGLGLGLSMSRSIVVAHGGSLDVVSDGSGCCFRITLPTAERAIIA
jgi:two-component system sensor kinase FixL